MNELPRICKKMPVGKFSMQHDAETDRIRIFPNPGGVVMSDGIIVLTTFPDQPGAEQLARELVEKKLAACVNILPPMTSVYQWRGNVESGREHQLVIKTRRPLFKRIEALVGERHPYELPELLALPVQGGSRDYLAWIREVTDE